MLVFGIGWRVVQAPSEKILTDCSVWLFDSFEFWEQFNSRVCQLFRFPTDSVLAFWFFQHMRRCSHVLVFDGPWFSGQTWIWFSNISTTWATACATKSFERMSLVFPKEGWGCTSLGLEPFIVWADAMMSPRTSCPFWPPWSVSWPPHPMHDLI